MDRGTVKRRGRGKASMSAPAATPRHSQHLRDDPRAGVTEDEPVAPACRSFGRAVRSAEAETREGDASSRRPSSEPTVD